MEANDIHSIDVDVKKLNELKVSLEETKIKYLETHTPDQLKFKERADKAKEKLTLALETYKHSLTKDQKELSMTQRDYSNQIKQMKVEIKQKIAKIKQNGYKNLKKIK